MDGACLHAELARELRAALLGSRRDRREGDLAAAEPPSRRCRSRTTPNGHGIMARAVILPRRDRSGWPAAFRGSQAIAAGLVTRGRPRGPRFQRLLPDVYCRAVAKPDLLLRSLAAYRLVEGRGVLAGYSAALVLGAACTPHPDTPAEVTVRATFVRSRA